MTVLRGLLVLALSAVLGSVLFGGVARAATGINQQISFQGKLVTASGTNLPDGTYNLQFKIYQDGSATGGGTLKWTESRLVSASQGVTVTAGTFQVNLGSVAPFGSQIDWNQDTLWLSMNVGGTGTTPVWDGEMTPYIRLTAVPYALNAGMVGGLTASQLVQLTPGSQQSGSINVSGNIATGGSLQAATIDTPTSGILTVGSTNTTGITLNKNTSITSGQTLSVGGQTVFSGVGILQAAALSSSVVYSNLTQVGTITTGIWNAGVIAPSYGGTGNSSYTIGDLLYATGATALGKLSAGASGTCLKSAGAAAAPAYGTCYTASLQSAFDGGNTITEPSTSTLTLASTATAPTVDQFVIDNTASGGITTAGVNAENIKYKGGAAAIEGAGLRVDYTPGTTSGGIWSGIRVVAGATGPVSGVTAYGIKLEGPTTQGAGQEEGVYIGSGWDVGLDIASGGIQMAAQNDPATPAAGQLRLYAKSVAGRVMPQWVGPAGVDTPVQASFGFNRIAMTAASGAGTTLAAALNSYGNTPASGGTATFTFAAATQASTNLATSVRRTTFKTPATTSAYDYVTAGAASVWRGNAAGLGGFFYTTRFSLSTLVTANRFFVGLANTNPTASADPVTETTLNKLGVAIDVNTGNLQWVNNVAGTTPTKTDLGTNFPVAINTLYELVIFSPPNGSSITYRVQNVSTGAVTADTTVSTNIPANTTFLTPLYWLGTSTTFGSAGIDTAGWYLESDN